MMNSSENSFSFSVPWDLSHGSPEELDEVRNRSTVPQPLPNVQFPVQMPMFNIGSGNITNAGGVAVRNAGGVAVRNAGERPRGAKPRGRPRGSKNKPKGENSAMKPIDLHVPPGVDIIDWVVNYARSRKVCVTVLAGHGAVSQVVVSHVGTQLPPLMFTEHLTLITISGAYLFCRSVEGSAMFFNASLGRVNGGIVGGTVRTMMSLGEVVLSATVFRNPAIFTIDATSA